MTEHNIVCKKLTEDKSKIVVVGLTTPKESFAKWSATPKEVNEMIKNGDTYFFTDEKGVTAEVEEVGDDFIRTKPDGKIHNILKIRDCKFS